MRRANDADMFAVDSALKVCCELSPKAHAVTQAVRDVPALLKFGGDSEPLCGRPRNLHVDGVQSDPNRLAGVYDDFVNR